MGYEFESAALPLPAAAAAAAAAAALECDWRRAEARLVQALAAAAQLTLRAAPNHPASIAARLRVAEARQRCWQLAAAIGDADD